MDWFMSYEQLNERQLCYSESVDVHLTAFVVRDERLYSGLRIYARVARQCMLTLRAWLWMDALSIDHLLARPWVIVGDEGMEGGVRNCFRCNVIQHMAKECLSREDGRGRGRGLRNIMRCLSWHIVGYMSLNSLGNLRRYVNSIIFFKINESPARPVVGDHVDGIKRQRTGLYWLFIVYNGQRDALDETNPHRRAELRSFASGLQFTFALFRKLDKMNKRSLLLFKWDWL